MLDAVLPVYDIIFCHFLVILVSKNLNERRSTKSDMSPVSLRSTLPSGKTQNRVSQVLQVQVPLNPLRKKSTAKDIASLSEYMPVLFLIRPCNVTFYHHVGTLLFNRLLCFKD